MKFAMALLIAAFSTMVGASSADALPARVVTPDGIVFNLIFQNSTIEVYEAKSPATVDMSKVSVAFQDLILTESLCQLFQPTHTLVGLRSECAWKDHFSGGAISVDVTMDFYTGMARERLTTVVVTRSGWSE